MRSRLRALRRAGVQFGIVLYALVLGVSPVLHHDLACHLKTPTDCTACQATTTAPMAVATVRVAPPSTRPPATIESRGETPILPAVRTSNIVDRAPPA